MFGLVLPLTESNQSIFPTVLREGVRKSTNLLIWLVFCHYAPAKRPCAKNTQAGLHKNIARAMESVGQRHEDPVMFSSLHL